MNNEKKNKKVDVKTELKKARDYTQEHPLCADARVIDKYIDLLCGLVLVAEENHINQTYEWENSTLAHEYLAVAVSLLPYDEGLLTGFKATSRMAQTVRQHPRLRLSLLRLEAQYIERLQSLQCDEVDQRIEELNDEIAQTEQRIALADQGKLDLITSISFIKTDPIEWTVQWEEVIDDVEREIYEKIKNQSWGMGFCHSYWNVKSQVLCQYGISWQSPAVLNPNILFD